MLKIMLVFGTRPEAIKMCPIIKQLEKKENVQYVVCVTGQHKEMLTQVLDVFNVKPKYNLEIMKENQDLTDITSNVLIKLRPILILEKPDIVLVHGDTTTTFAAALACFYLNIPVGHVEAGLRTYNMKSPYPEEFNRQVVSKIATYHFAPTKRSYKNLILENVKSDKIIVTGNTAIDALKFTLTQKSNLKILEWVGDSKLILLTAHRRENQGEPLRNVFTAIKDILSKYVDVKVVYPIHRNPNIRKLANEIFSNDDRIRLVEPLDVIDFHALMNNSFIIITDSGGIQEEAPSLKKPVLVIRETTERPEGVEAGTLKLIGTSYESVFRNLDLLLSDENEYKKFLEVVNPYGDGTASQQIVDFLISEYK